MVWRQTWSDWESFGDILSVNRHFLLPAEIVNQGTILKSMENFISKRISLFRDITKAIIWTIINFDITNSHWQ